MNLKEPRRKKRPYYPQQSPFPINIGKKDQWHVYTAHLGVAGACIADPDEMKSVHTMGYFGKGSLSKSIPRFGARRFGAPPIVRDRQWKRRQEWLEEVKHLSIFPLDIKQELITLDNDSAEAGESSQANKNDEPMEISIDLDDDPKIIDDKTTRDSKSKAPEIDEVVLDSAEEEEVCEIIDKTDERSRNDSQSDDIRVLNDDQDHNDYNFSYDCYDPTSNEEINLNETLVLPDSDSDTENYLNDVEPRIETEAFPLTETLLLTFEETFFLMFGLGCLQLVDYEGKVMSIADAWTHFNQDKLFLPRYIVYHYFRSKGWVVKAGLKFGCDFLLYKQGPPFYHASYTVIVDTADADTLLRDDSRCTRKMNWKSLLQMNRLNEITAKEFLIAQVLWPSSVPQTNPVPLESISEFTVRELLWRRWKTNDKDESSKDDDSSDDSS
ncbi:tRNA-splicing endonuclease subunit Sen2 [Microplitis demolitor]|uniref:tRNA-splicing endonuclease subunit Sen2 n=1 Tax=Microplitis demolitor TaxID=69319 RepID=UPI0004CCB52A|nr:tRNA-splicing endonuclease subunit Sen2 [Microplitis demolitor]